jgi:hypothetical protein
MAADDAQIAVPVAEQLGQHRTLRAEHVLTATPILTATSRSHAVSSPAGADARTFVAGSHQP